MGSKFDENQLIKCGKLATAGSVIGAALGGGAGLAVDAASHGWTCGTCVAFGALKGGALGSSLAASGCGALWAKCLHQCQK